MKESSRDRNNISIDEPAVNGSPTHALTWREVADFRVRLLTLSDAQAIEVIQSLVRFLVAQSGREVRR
jgi:hypothetical protein